MKSRHLILIAGLIAVGMLPAPAQQKDANKQKLVELRKTIEGLDWEKVDFAALPPLGRCRTLLLLNHALDELGSIALAEADLAGAFLDEKNLSAAYAANPSADAPLARTFEDARKIAAALLQGPMAKSRYSSDLADTDANGLAAYEKVYDTTCRRKWETFTDNSRALRSMVAFLKANGKLKEYMSWAPTETDRRQREFEQASAALPAATTAPAARPAPPPGPAAEAATPAAQQQERIDSQPAQQALYAAQQPPPTEVEVGDDDGWYSGWYYGAVDNLKRDQALHRNVVYQEQARARVQQRQANVPQQRPTNAPPTKAPPTKAPPTAAPPTNAPPAAVPRTGGAGGGRR